MKLCITGQTTYLLLLQGLKITERPITDSYYAPFELYERGKFDEILEGLVHAHAQNEDPAIADAISNRMFMDRNGSNTSI